MTHFLGTHQNRLDAKGRVSIPASFRSALKKQSQNGDGNGSVQLILRRSHQYPCIEAWPETAFAALARSLSELEQFSPEREDFATTLYSDAYPLETDKEGRIVLPGDLAAHANLTEAVAFMGLGETFQIWEPSAAEQRRTQARDRTRDNRVTLRGNASP